MIAGMSYTEMQEMQPGLIMDAYILRRNYDDMMHGIKRGEDSAWLTGSM